MADPPPGDSLATVGLADRLVADRTTSLVAGPQIRAMDRDRLAGGFAHGLDADAAGGALTLVPLGHDPGNPSVELAALLGEAADAGAEAPAEPEVLLDRG